MASSAGQINTPTGGIPNCTACDDSTVAVARCNDCKDNLCKTCLDSHKRLRALNKHRVSPIRLCPSCEASNRHAVAVARCVDCDDVMCTECLESHNRLRALKDHRVSNLDQLTPNVAPAIVRRNSSLKNSNLDQLTPNVATAPAVVRRNSSLKNSNSGVKQHLLRRVGEFGREGEVRVLAGRGLATTSNGSTVIVDCQGLKVFNSNGKIRFYFNMQQGFPSEKSQLSDVAVTSEGLIIVADETPNVKVFNLDGRYVRQFFAISPDGKSSAETKSRLVAITVDPKGEILIGNGNKPYYISIHKGAQNGHHVTSIKTGIEPRCIAVSPSNNKIAIGCWSDGTVNVFNRSDQKSQTVADPKHLKWLPVGLCWTPEEDILITNVGSPGIGIYRFDASGQLLGCVTEDVKYPWGIVLKDGTGKEVVVADTESIKVFRWHWQ